MSGENVEGLEVLQEEFNSLVYSAGDQGFSIEPVINSMVALDEEKGEVELSLQDKKELATLILCKSSMAPYLSINYVIRY